MEDKLPVGLRFSLLDRAFKKQLDEMLKDRGLTGVQFFVLGQLSRLEREGSTEINQRALENATRVTHPTMTAIIQRLEKGGFIRCETSSSDRRNKNIFSTEKAASLRRDMNELDAEIFARLCRGLEPAQVRALMEITDIMLKNAFENCCKGEKEA